MGADRIDRRTALATPALLLLCGMGRPTSKSQTSKAALQEFLTAFENCDLARMEAAFAPDATYFDRAPAGQKVTPGEYRRGRGMPPGMRRLATELPKTRAGPPFLALRPHDLLIQAGADVAVCTFHLDDPDSLGRRTVVLQRRQGAWKIIHIHASTVALG
jgi:ketosteroid isomerase-like protein